MAYDLHIQREPADDPEPIRFEEWQEAVGKTEGVRLAATDYTEGRNPRTGEVIRIKESHGDAEVFFADEGVWFRAFRWRGGSASFNSPGEFPNPVWHAAASLAYLLNAEIRGDEGEAYDATTGQMI